VSGLALALTLGATFSRWGALSAVGGVAIYALAARARWLFVAALAVAVTGVALDASGLTGERRVSAPSHTTRP